MSTRNTHRCPAWRCPAEIPDRLLACPRHWAALSKPVQDAIYATARKSLLDPDLRAALAAAREEWGMAS
jgi:hypothetical protein